MPCFSDIKTANYSFAPADWDSVSEDAKTLVRQLLEVNPEKRLTAEAAVEHRWMDYDSRRSTRIRLAGVKLTELRPHIRLKHSRADSHATSSGPGVIRVYSNLDGRVSCRIRGPTGRARCATNEKCVMISAVPIVT